jgi:23S rRNA pseudouridine2605 synthase
MSEAENPSGERLAKVMSRAGICSRRDAEGWITSGRVSVNGDIVRTPAFNVTEKDKIAVDGKPIARREPTQVWLYHKPAGLMVTEKDPEGRATVFEEFEKLGLPRVLTVGRLDYNTEGLLLLTNDGGVKRTLELPATGWVRRYRVRAFGAVTQEQLDTLKSGISVEGVDYGPIEAVLDTTKGGNVWLTMALREGKNREVRNVLGHLGLEVNRLIRLSYGPFQLGDLPVGAVEKVKTRILKDQLGNRLADQSNADFDTPMPEGRPGAAPEPRRRMPEKEQRRAPERNRFGGPAFRPEKRPERPAAPERTVHFDDGRPPERFAPQRRGKPGERPERGERGDRPFRDKPAGNSFSDKPRGPRSDDARPARSGDRPFSKGPRPTRDGDDARPRTGGPRRFDDKKPGGGKPFGDRPHRARTDDARPARSGGDRPFSKGPRPARDGDDARPRTGGPRRFEGKPGGKPGGAPRGDRPQGERRFEGDRPRSPRPAGARDGKPFERSGGKPGGAPRGARPGGGKPAGGRPSGGAPRGDRPQGGPRGGKPSGGRPGPRRDS